MNYVNYTNINNQLTDLRVTLQSSISSQTTWNEKHDERSREILHEMNKKIDLLFDYNKKIVENIGSLECDEHSTKIKLGLNLADEKISSVEKRVNWLWTVTGIAVLTAAIKSFITIFKS